MQKSPLGEHDALRIEGEPLAAPAADFSTCSAPRGNGLRTMPVASSVLALD